MRNFRFISGYLASRRKPNGMPAFAGMTVIVEKSVPKNTVMPAKAGSPFSFFFSLSSSKRYVDTHAARRKGYLCFLGCLAVAYVLFVSQSHADTPKLDPALCQSLVDYQPDDDVAYKPGVDAEGNAVAPADVPGSQQIKLPKKIKIPLTVNLAQSLNLNTSAYPYNQLGEGTEMNLGVLTVEGNKVLFNGKALSDDQQSKLEELCNKQQ